MATKYLKGKIYQLDVPTLQSNPGQLRMFIDPGGLAEMAASIRRNGLIEPIVFRQNEYLTNKIYPIPITLFRKRRLS